LFSVDRLEAHAKSLAVAQCLSDEMLNPVSRL
jgi:hypothetical protein